MFTIYVGGFELMPHPRLPYNRVAQRINERAQKYFTNRDELAWKIKEAMQASDARTHEAPVSLTAHIALTHNRKCDIDNLLKTLMDAMQVSSLIKDDSLVHNVNITITKGTANPCVAFRLQRHEQ